MGVHIAVDDFGSGYSSLKYFRDCPVDSLRIDRSFVRDVVGDPGAASIVGAAIGMARSLKCRVVAQGVETAQEVAALRALGCDEGQGDYLGRAVVAEEFAHPVALVGDDEIVRVSTPTQAREIADAYDTTVGERRVTLSEGQRLAIGRALHGAATLLPD
jgi:EAL domain-containing protein (putative c-di-GMP-specific phosphodiesterase class I)